MMNLSITEVEQLIRAMEPDPTVDVEREAQLIARGAHVILPNGTPIIYRDGKHLIHPNKEDQYFVDEVLCGPQDD